MKVISKLSAARVEAMKDLALSTALGNTAQYLMHLSSTRIFENQFRPRHLVVFLI